MRKPWRLCRGFAGCCLRNTFGESSGIATMPPLLPLPFHDGPTGHRQLPKPELRNLNELAAYSSSGSGLSSQDCLLGLMGVHFFREIPIPYNPPTQSDRRGEPSLARYGVNGPSLLRPAFAMMSSAAFESDPSKTAT